MIEGQSKMVQWVMGFTKKCFGCTDGWKHSRYYHVRTGLCWGQLREVGSWIDQCWKSLLPAWFIWYLLPSGQIIICPQFVFIYPYLAPIHHFCQYVSLFTYIYPYLVLFVYMHSYLGLSSLIWSYLPLIALLWPTVPCHNSKGKLIKSEIMSSSVTFIRSWGKLKDHLWLHIYYSYKHWWWHINYFWDIR